ncbi:helix-turn-helix domain-containing protein [bacterium]|nr:helix-turn-helix domain-containing protein [bacterium]
MDSPYLSVAQVAQLLGRTPKWVYENKGVIPGFFKLGGSIFFDREVLESGLKNAATQPAKRPKPDSRNDRHGLLS